MARKPAAEKSKMRITDRVIAAQRKKFGDDSISSSGGYGDISRYLDTGIIALNYAIGHEGVPEGRITSLQGPEQAGKTSTITTILATAQARGALCVYIDAEYKFDRKYAARLGLYDDATLPDAIAKGKATEETLPLIIIYPEHIQRVFQQIEKLIEDIREEDPDVEVFIAWDSVAATPSTAEFEANYDSMAPGSPARQMSAGLKKLCFTLARERVTMLIVNQEKESIGMMGQGSKVATIAQRPIAFHSTVRIEVKKWGFVAGSGEDGKKEENSIGIKVAAKIAKNQCGPFGRVARYNLITVGRDIGVDNDAWILDYALDGVKPGIVVKSGAYYNMRGSTDKFYRKDFATSPDYTSICTQVRASMAEELAKRFGEWDGKAESEDDDSEADDTQAEAFGSWKKEEDNE